MTPRHPQEHRSAKFVPVRELPRGTPERRLDPAALRDTRFSCYRDAPDERSGTASLRVLGVSRRSGSGSCPGENQRGERGPVQRRTRRSVPAANKPKSKLPWPRGHRALATTPDQQRQLPAAQTPATDHPAQGNLTVSCRSWWRSSRQGWLERRLRKSVANWASGSSRSLVWFPTGSAVEGVQAGPSEALVARTAPPGA